jgi:hypothetical protein
MKLKLELFDHSEKPEKRYESLKGVSITDGVDTASCD